MSVCSLKQGQRTPWGLSCSTHGQITQTLASKIQCKKSEKIFQKQHIFCFINNTILCSNKFKGHPSFYSVQPDLKNVNIRSSHLYFFPYYMVKCVNGYPSLDVALSKEALSYKKLVSKYSQTASLLDYECLLTCNIQGLNVSQDTQMVFHQNGYLVNHAVNGNWRAELKQ